MSKPAFPSHGTMGEVAHEGMTLRDYFAGQVIGAYISALEAKIPRANPMPENFSIEAENAYALADAMLRARQA